MAKSLREWVESDVAAVKEQPLQWLSEVHFFRDPSRPMYSDTAFFFSPADGILLYQQRVRPNESILDIKGKPCSLREALRNRRKVELTYQSANASEPSTRTIAPYGFVYASGMWYTIADCGLLTCCGLRTVQHDLITRRTRRSRLSVRSPQLVRSQLSAVCQQTPLCCRRSSCR